MIVTTNCDIQKFEYSKCTLKITFNQSLFKQYKRSLISSIISFSSSMLILTNFFQTSFAQNRFIHRCLPLFFNRVWHVAYPLLLSSSMFHRRGGMFVRVSYNPQPATYHRQSPRGQFKTLQLPFRPRHPLTAGICSFFFKIISPDPLNWKLTRTIGSGSRFRRVDTATRFKC